MPSPDRIAAYVEAVGVVAISQRLDAVYDQLASVRGELDANEREHKELVDRNNMLVDEYDRLSRKLESLTTEATT